MKLLALILVRKVMVVSELKCYTIIEISYIIHTFNDHLLNVKPFNINYPFLSIHIRF